MSIYTDSPFSSQLLTMAGLTTEEVTLHDNCHTVVVTFADGGTSGDSVAVQWIKEGYATSGVFGLFTINFGTAVVLPVQPASKRPGSKKFQVRKGVASGTYLINVTQVCGNEV